MTSAGANYSVKQTATYSFSGSPMYPVKVGNVSNVTEIDKMVRTVNGETETVTETHNYVYKVEKVESVTVPAGTFKCFKVVQYESGKIKGIDWDAPQVKMYAVKNIDNEEPVSTSELVSYSLK